MQIPTSQFLWCTRGKDWGFRFLSGCHDLTPAAIQKIYKKAFENQSMLGCWTGKVNQHHAYLACRYRDCRRDESHRPITHEFLIFGSLTEMEIIDKDGLEQCIFHQVEEFYKSIYDLPDKEVVKHKLPDDFVLSVPTIATQNTTRISNTKGSLMKNQGEQDATGRKPMKKTVKFILFCMVGAFVVGAIQGILEYDKADQSTSNTVSQSESPADSRYSPEDLDLIQDAEKYLKSANLKYPSDKTVKMICIAGQLDKLERVRSNGYVNWSMPELLFVSSDLGRADCCEFLLNNGASANIYDSAGLAPIYYAVRKDRVAAYNVLVQHKADVQNKDQNNCNLLHWAAFNGNIELCKDLIQRGIDVSSKDANGNTALHYAARFDFQSRINLVKKVAAIFSDKSLYNLDVCNFLIFKGLSVNEKDTNGYTPLFYAAKNGNIELCRLLVSQDATVTQAIIKQASTSELKDFLKDHLSKK